MGALSRMKFNIRLVKPVMFTDRTGKVTHWYNIGKIFEATADAGHYWVCNAPGGIFKDEAVELEDPIDERWIQLGDS